MSCVARGLRFKETAEQSFDLFSCGKLYGAAFASGGVMPRYMPADCGFTPDITQVEAGYAAKDGAIFMVSGGSLYRKTADGTQFDIIAQGLERVPFFAEYDGGILIGDGVTDYTYSGGSIAGQSAQYALYGGVIHYSRLFGADLSDGYTVRWSSSCTTDDYTEGLRFSGWLTLAPQRGKILGLVPYNDRLVAVRERGLSVIRVYGETENFRISSSDTDTESIIGGTAAVCAGKLFFATCSGLYSYDGSDITRECADGLDGLGQIVRGTACGNYYFASVNTGGGTLLACIDGISGEISFCDIAAESLFSGGEAYVASGGRLYCLYYPSQNIVYSGSTNLGVCGKKFLKYIFIDGEGACDVTIKSNGVSRIFKGVSGKASVKMSGDVFLITIAAGGAVYSAQAVFGV